MDTPPSVTEDATVTVAARGGACSETQRAAVAPARSTRYVTIEELGRGGMGIVVRAYDARLRREVALKSVRSEAVSGAAREEMLREAQAMARLSHPNVVAIYDVSDGDSEHVLLAMEYVRGRTLREWMLDTSGGARPWSDVVAAFCAAGRGLSAAHAAGLLHRDFKPANVLVGDDGRVRVTDFGLARVHETRQDDTAPETGDVQAGYHGDSLDLTRTLSVAGTLRYMAPEQHDAGSTSVTGSAATPLGPATDQYAFCVALWEALVGYKPFAGDTNEGLLAAKRRGPPPWPREIRAPRRIEVALRRGLAPRPEDRWPSMDALLHVLLLDPSQPRRRWIIGASLVSTLVITSGVVWNAWHRAVAMRCSGASAALSGAWSPSRREAVRQAMLDTGLAYAADTWTRVDRELATYADDWLAMHEDACEATNVRGQQTVAVMDLRMACLHRANGELRAVTELFSRADAQVVEKAHRVLGTLPELDRCADTAVLQAEVAPPDPRHAQAVEVARFELSELEALRNAGKLREAQDRVESVEQQVRLIPYPPLQTELELELGQLWRAAGDYGRSEAALRHGLRSALRWKQWDLARLAATDLISTVGLRQARPREGLVFAETARGLSPPIERDRQARARADALLHNNVGNVLWALGNYDEAEATLRQSLALALEQHGPEHDDVAAARTNLGTVLWDLERYDEAEVEHRAAYTVLKKVLGPEHPLVAAALSNIGNVLWGQRRYAEAEAEFRRALALLTRTVDPKHPSIGTGHLSLGAALVQQGKGEEAEREFRQALVLLETALGPEHPNVALTHSNLASALLEQGRNEEAEVHLRRTLAVSEKTLAPTHPSIAFACHDLGVALAVQGKAAAAEAQFFRAVMLREKVLPSDHHLLARSRAALAEALLDQQRPVEALPLAELAWGVLQREDIAAKEQAHAAFVLARALWERHADAARARAVRSRVHELAERAVEAYAMAGDPATAVREWQQRVGLRR